MAAAKRPSLNFFIEIPPSPLHRTYSSIASTGLKENSTRVDQPQFIIHKRKLSDQPNNSNISKKPKLSNDKYSHAHLPSDNFPNGSFYCHQCNKKRDNSIGIQCTVNEVKENRNEKEWRRCGVKMCKPCLKNRYGKDIDEIKKSSIREEGHVSYETYTFKCPKCENICNCSRCRKLKGLEPTGNLTFVVRRSGGESVAQALADNVNLTGIMPGKGCQKDNFPVLVPIQPHKSTMKSNKDKAHATISGKAEAKPKRVRRKPRSVLPVISWNKVPARLSLDDAMNRIQIREFMLRFACVMHPTVSMTHLDELEEIGGNIGSQDEGDYSAWVSGACCRSVMLGLLSLFVEDTTNGAKVKDVVRDIKAAGMNWNRIWSLLSDLRARLAERDTSPIADGKDINGTAKSPRDNYSLQFPDPLPLCQPRDMRPSTRGLSGTIITSTAQLVPVLAGIIESSLATPVIRNEIEEAVKEGKGDTKTVREAIKKEKDRWDCERKIIEGRTPRRDNNDSNLIKTRRNEHKETLRNLENALTLIQYDFIPRYNGFLGKDSDGREYYSLTPGQAERIAASELAKNHLAGKKDKAKGRSGRGREKWTEEERGALRDWSWFVAVWGEKPVNAAPIHRHMALDEDESELSDVEDDGSSRWWGFSDPVDIKKLAKYVSIKAELDQLEEGEMGDHAAMKLVESLTDFADCLQWRIGREGR